MKNLHLLVGLGNIGLEYELTRHNFGFLLLDQIIADYGFNKIAAKKFHSEVFSGEINGHKIVALKPHTFMNRSGLAVLEACNFYKITHHHVIVLHDEIDITLGKIRVKIGGGSAGHNGLKSIDEVIGKDYIRLRLGVGRPQNKEFEVSDYVLSKFSKEELEIVERVNKKISKSFSNLVEENFDGFLNDFNS